jgi:predicted extracellular nuclease
MVGGRDETRPIREAEAEAVKSIIEERFQDPARSDWLVVGDFNDYTEADGAPDQNHALKPLLDNQFSINLLRERINDWRERWTHYYHSEKSYRQLDYILASPSLAQKNPNAVPEIIREGQPYRADWYNGDRWPRVGYDRPKASDHCPVVVTLDY